MSVDLTIKPIASQWVEQIKQQSKGKLFTKPLSYWRSLSREELGLARDRPILATGHQTLLWHPGILAKYFAASVAAFKHGWATANLVVDQHAEGFGNFEVPIRSADGSLAVQRIELTREREGVPMARHDAFQPKQTQRVMTFALSAVQSGVERILKTIHAHQDSQNAAEQMACSLDDLMRPWVEPMVHVSASRLILTTLSQSMIHAMIDDAEHCVKCYNRAVEKVPEAGIGPLQIRDNDFEVPLWRITSDGKREYAYVSDLRDWQDEYPPQFLPRALFMTALVRLGMCDLYIHGTGGARYDRAMELWLNDWLGVSPCSIAVATATLRLPLLNENEEQINFDEATASARHLWHDPEGKLGDGRPGADKRGILEEINQLPRNSTERRTAFFKMHEYLDELRDSHSGKIQQVNERVRIAKKQKNDREIAARRDWPFPLYPDDMLNELAEAVANQFGVSQLSVF